MIYSDDNDCHVHIQKCNKRKSKNNKGNIKWTNHKREEIFRNVDEKIRGIQDNQKVFHFLTFRTLLVIHLTCMLWMCCLVWSLPYNYPVGHQHQQCAFASMCFFLPNYSKMECTFIGCLYSMLLKLCWFICDIQFLWPYYELQYLHIF